ncbi:FxLD family lanthipeptide, partial [Streptomyces afghaniensis]|uniref:FxLD family lanthipeptide n=1 Tax=Streptomyces afghaniensis TaxID=66865 RepID=UPI003CC8A592
MPHHPSPLGGKHDRHADGEADAPAQPNLATTDETDPFGLDITFIEGTPATETVLMCSTGDTCGSS